MKKIIGLIDCDSFFASCEQTLNPSLKDKPICVVTGGKNGCIVSRSREAKAMGIPIGAPYFQVYARFPNIIFRAAQHEKYSAISNNVMDCIKTFSPLVEVVSIDEAYIDLTGSNNMYGKEETDIALDIREKN